ncbi:MAG: mechanosensitive ion channel [Alphaproteobacteria bacterium]|nr:mechanosensitive ion channel [Alphaproteobacteria bacterium]
MNLEQFEPYAWPIGYSVLILVGSVITLLLARKLKVDFISRFYTKRMARRQAKRLDGYFKLLGYVLGFAVGVGALTGFAKIWWPRFFSTLWESILPFVGGVGKYAGLIAFFIVAWELAYYFIYKAIYYRHERHPQRAETLFPFAVNACTLALFLIGLFMVMREAGVDVMPLLTGAGIAGLALGLGAQQSIRDIIAGFTIILEDLIQVGDVAKVGGCTGLVERLTLRKIQLRDLAGIVYTIPYSEVKVIENWTKDYSFYITDIGVDYGTDLDHAEQVIRETGAALRADETIGPNILEDIEILGVDQFADSAIIIKARFKTLPIKQWEVGRAFNKRLKAAFDKAGISIPFPQRTLHIAQADTALLAKAEGGAGRGA